ncbi:hypothetical protein UT300019_02720 [Clostridium sp. CTA-19]
MEKEKNQKVINKDCEKIEESLEVTDTGIDLENEESNAVVLGISMSD